jgi:hypothetical protein
VGGAHTIINHLEIGQIILPNYSRESRHMDRLHAAMQNAGLTPYILKNPLFVTLDGADFIIDPSGLDYFHFPRTADEDDDYRDDYADSPHEASDIPEADDFSIVVSVSHGENHFLFTGDASNHRLNEVLQNEILMALDYLFLKVPRHGRHTRRAVELIYALRPRYAVITGFCPTHIDTYYPERPTDERILAALEYVGAEVFFTMSETFFYQHD